jgi:hypothetical protein
MDHQYDAVIFGVNLGGGAHILMNLFIWGIIIAGSYLWWQFRWAPIRIAERRGVNPALIGALSIGANARETAMLIAYASTAEPDRHREWQHRDDMEKTFSDALDKRITRRSANTGGGLARTVCRPQGAAIDSYSMSATANQRYGVLSRSARLPASV